MAANVIWFMLPFAMLMILAGLQGVSDETLEAAEIDGASPLQRHLHVIIPSIRGVLGFVLLIFTMDVHPDLRLAHPAVAAALTSATSRSCSTSTTSPSARVAVNLGLGSAISVLTIILILVLLYPSIRSIVKEARA